MRKQYKCLTALVVAMLAASGAVAETTPAAAPTAASPSGYMNPFDPNWWLLTFNNMVRLTTLPLAYATPGAAAPAATYPQGYLNPFDPNAWLAAAPTAAGPTQAAAPAQGSPYVTMQTPYGPVYTFNYADPMAWNKLFAQPFATPGQ